MDNAKLALDFIELFGKIDNANGVQLVSTFFEFIDSNEQMKQALQIDDKLSVIRNVLSSSIRTLYANKPSQRDEYLLLVNNLFGDIHDVGTLISSLMNVVQQLQLNGVEKKEMIKNLFNRIIEYSPLDDKEKRLAHYAFSGIVEAIIWAKHGGLSKTKKKCSLLCK